MSKHIQKALFNRARKFRNSNLKRDMGGKKNWSTHEKHIWPTFQNSRCLSGPCVPSSFITSAFLSITIQLNQRRVWAIVTDATEITNTEFKWEGNHAGRNTHFTRLTSLIFWGNKNKTIYSTIISISRDDVWETGHVMGLLEFCRDPASACIFPSLLIPPLSIRQEPMGI